MLELFYNAANASISVILAHHCLGVDHVSASIEAGVLQDPGGGVFRLQCKLL